MQLLFVDTETGGLNPYKHSLLEVGVIAQVDGVERGTLKFYISQDSYIVTDQAMRINGLNLNDVKKNGISTKEALKKIKIFVNEHFGNEKPILVGHNPSIDKYMIRQQIFEANGEEMDDVISYRMIDTMSIIWFLHMADKLPRQACNSSGAFHHFGIIVEKRHNALDDCIATAKLYRHLLIKAKGECGIEAHQQL